MIRSLASRIRAANSAIVTEGNLDAMEEFFTADYVAHLTGRDTKGGLAEIRRFLGAVRRAFPDLETKVEVLVEADRRVAWQRTSRGTQRGSFLGFPACGRRIVWRDMGTSRFRGGRIAEEWILTDLAERLLLERRR